MGESTKGSAYNYSIFQPKEIKNVGTCYSSRKFEILNLKLALLVIRMGK